MSMINGFIFLCFYCIVPIQYFILRNESKPKKNIILGVTLPYEARQGEEVAAVSARFRRRETAAFVLLTAAALPALLPVSFSVALLYLSVWLIAALIVPYVPFVRANRELKALKRERGWGVLSARVDAVVDLSAAAQERAPLAWWQFLLPAAVSAVPVVYTLAADRGNVDYWGVLVGCGCITLTIALCCFLYRLIFHQRSEVVDGNTDLTAALTRVRRQHWGRNLLSISWLTALFNLCLWRMVHSQSGLLAAALLYTGALLAVTLYVELNVRDIQARLTARSGRGEMVDEDRYWLWGLIYYNPNDRHVMVNQRVGASMSLNAARPAGKMILVVSALVILLLPFLGIWLMSEEHTSVTMTMTEEALVMEHTSVAYEVPLEDIVSVELLETLPPCSRQMGTGMDTLLKGRFALEDGTRAQLCLNPQVPPFLRVETPDTLYLFGSGDAGETRAVYEALTAGME